MAGMKAKLLRTALRGIGLAGLDRVAAPLTRGQDVILMLHHVLPEDPPPFSPNRILQITPEYLDSVIREVRKQGYEIVSLDEAAERVKRQGRSAGCFACFTFDDGYLDNAVHAYPIFKAHDAPMAVYVSPGLVDRAATLWGLTFEDVIRRMDEIEVDLPEGRRVFSCRGLKAKNETFDRIYWWLRTLPDVEIHRHVDRLAAVAGIDPHSRCDQLMMSWDQLRKFAREPLVTIGAHTVSHTALAKAPAALARYEMMESVRRLEQELGRPCRHFAYPYGDAASAAERKFDVAAEIGLRTAVTTRKGVIGAGAAQSITALPRLSLNGDYQDLALFRVLLNGLPFAMLDTARAARKRLASIPSPGRLNPASASTR